MFDTKWIKYIGGAIGGVVAGFAIMFGGSQIVYPAISQLVGLSVASSATAWNNVADGAKLISLRRFIYNSWPNNIQYGTVFKGTMLKAAKIQWYSWEEQLQTEYPVDTSLT